MKVLLTYFFLGACKPSFPCWWLINQSCSLGFETHPKTTFWRSFSWYGYLPPVISPCFTFPCVSVSLCCCVLSALSLAWSPHCLLLIIQSTHAAAQPSSASPDCDSDFVHLFGTFVLCLAYPDLPVLQDIPLLSPQLCRALSRLRLLTPSALHQLSVSLSASSQPATANSTLLKIDSLTV